MYSVELLRPNVHRAVRRFAVAWRNRVQRSINHVGVLDYDSDTYRFQYLNGVGSTVEDFRPFIGFPDLERVYESPRLWPFFALRVMDRKRPDYPQYLRWLGLQTDASRLDVLGLSGGEQKGDTVSLAESPPVADDGATESTFLVRGSSYAVRTYNSTAAVDRLQPGDGLLIVDDAANEANPEALLLTSSDGAPVGWVPDLLIGYARELRDRNGAATVKQNNGPDVAWHMRLLVRLAGQVSPSSSPFTGGIWPPMGRGRLK